MRSFGLRALTWPLKTKDVDKIIASLQRDQDTISAALQIDQTFVTLPSHSHLPRLTPK
jgi:hypothetical protein